MAKIVENEEVKEVKKAKKVEPVENENWLKEKVAIRLFKDNGKYSDDVTVGVNGRVWQIKRGVDVMIPRFVWLVLAESLEQAERTAMFIDEESRSFEKDKRYLGLD